MPALESPRDGELGVRDDGPEQEAPHGCDWACTTPGCNNDEPNALAGDCPDCGQPLQLIDAEGYEVQP